MDEIVKEIVPLAVAARKRRTSLVDFCIRLVKQKPLGAVSGIIFLALLIVGIFADLLAPYGMNEPHLWDRLSPPSAQYLLGTDNLGRDLLSRCIYGARVSLVVGAAGTSLAILLAAAIGIVSGFSGGKVDIVTQRFVDAWMSFPGLFILITVMSILGPGIVQVTVVLGVLFGISGSRVIRSAVIAINQNLYVKAAKAIGCSSTRIVFRHILPNIMAPILVLFTTNMGTVILSEAGLSFLGFGVPPGTASWGNMLSGEGRQYMELAPWLALWPGICLSVAVFSINMFGDAVRDLLDPRLKGRMGRYGGVKEKSRLARSSR
jgi:peptide/nickel transport system permease protein